MLRGTQAPDSLPVAYPGSSGVLSNSSSGHVDEASIYTLTPPSFALMLSFRFSPSYSLSLPPSLSISPSFLSYSVSLCLMFSFSPATRHSNNTCSCHPKAWARARHWACASWRDPGSVHASMCWIFCSKDSHRIPRALSASSLSHGRRVDFLLLRGRKQNTGAGENLAPGPPVYG